MMAPPPPHGLAEVGARPVGPAAQSRGTVRSEQSSDFFFFFLSHESKPLYWEEKPNLDFMV